MAFALAGSRALMENNPEKSSEVYKAFANISFWLGIINLTTIALASAAYLLIIFISRFQAHGDYYETGYLLIFFILLTFAEMLFGWIFSLLGLVFSLIGWRSDNRQKAKRGTMLAFVGLLFYILYAFWITPFLSMMLD